uniref:NUC domain-containing protein n=1 Tax=Elaeophora elaphi TaxID=1147741 RepID=A0A0R3S067_9BILA
MWGMIILFLVVAVIIFASLYVIARLKLQNHSDTVQPSVHYDLSICKRKFNVPPLLIVSSDGLRESYLNENVTPTIQRLIDYGTHSKYMLPTFPSKTFPNHYTIVTGLYPAWHGIVDNSFYDSQLKNFFKKSANESGWYLGEPIWETAKKAGLKSGVFFWPGRTALGKLPNYWVKYNKSIPFTHRVDTLTDWLKLPDDERPSLVQVRTAMILMDGMINYLINRLVEEGLMGCINFILLSDHGMQQMDKTRSVIAEDYLGPQFSDLFFPGVVARIKINQTAHSSQNDVDNVVNDLISKMECQHGNNYLMYRKNLVPIRFHYADSLRIGDIIIKGRPGVCIFQSGKEKESYKLSGDHGYDNRIDSMRAIFIAVGPDIALNRKIDDFQNIELYNLFTYLLRIAAASNNGTNGTLFNVLRNPPAFPITAIDRPSEQCTEKINIKMCSFSRDCSLMDDTYRNCSTILRSSVSVTYDFEGELCSLQLCDAIIHFDKKSRKTVMVEGILRNSVWMQEIKKNCVTFVDNVTQTNSCENPKNESYSPISLFGNLDRYYTYDLARLMVPKVFADGIWQYVLNETAEYLVKYGNLRFFSGAVYDQNGDGVRDSDYLIRKSDPSHLFFVLMWCENSALIGHTLCKDIAFVPYILPFNGRNLNCLKPSEYLYDNTVRMRDIELLVGMEFFANRNIWSDAEAIQLRTLLPQRR